MVCVHMYVCKRESARTLALRGEQLDEERCSALQIALSVPESRKTSN